MELIYLHVFLTSEIFYVNILMKSVQYTKLDGNTWILTANTVISSNIFIGNSLWGWEHPTKTGWLGYQFIGFANTELPKLANTWSNITTYTWSGNGTVAYFCDWEKKITDFGFALWASERLSSEDYESYDKMQLNLVASRERDPNFVTCDDTEFSYWFDRFLNDPNVVVNYTEEVPAITSFTYGNSYLTKQTCVMKNYP